MFVTVGYYKIMEIKQTRSEIKIETLQKETSAKGLCSLGTRYLLPLAPFSVKDQRHKLTKSSARKYLKPHYGFTGGKPGSG